ncbi:transposase [Xanthomonas oryzae pv. oryzae PXO99A]|uniref:Transposase n=1 Tax=Xanthomonas oryzae pv. oryzae (strain PXO99A) TaxID=360094 RepID=A0A0K0GN65_XANOP|nr:transposase [Xanthomonas oryzae pv. oryzae PXO99A]
MRADRSMLGPSLHRDQIMAMNRVQFQAGLSLPAFLKALWQRAAVRAGVGDLALATGLCLSALRRYRAQSIPASRHHVLAVHGLLSPDQPALGHGDGQQQAAATHLAAWHVSAGPESRRTCRRWS